MSEPAPGGACSRLTGFVDEVRFSVAEVLGGDEDIVGRRKGHVLSLSRIGADVKLILDVDLELVKPTAAEADLQILSLKESTKVPFAISPEGDIWQFWPPEKLTEHAPGLNSKSIGIEIINSGNSIDFYSGPQMDAVIQLTDYLMNTFAGDVLSGKRGRKRPIHSLATEYSLERSTPVTPIDDEGVVTGSLSGANRTAQTEPVVTHREVDRDYSGNIGGSEGCDHPIAGVDKDSNIFTIVGDQTARFPAKRRFAVSGSTGNDGNYKVVSVVGKPGSTDITVTPDIRDPTADGDISWICNSAGTRFRRADPAGTTYDIEAVTAALAYDFPGLVDTRGGDVGVVTASCLGDGNSDSCAGRGGDVNIGYGRRDDPALGLAAFPGLEGPESLINVVIDEGETRTCGLGPEVGPPLPSDLPRFGGGGGEVQVANLVVRGTLDIQDAPVASQTRKKCKIRVSGTMYVAPGGKIVGKTEFNGVDLEILAAGPVILHGMVDLSGADSVEGQAGWGGNLTVKSRAYSPLLVPTITTQGGDVGSLDPKAVSEDGVGGRGGNVTIQGPPNGLIVFSGMKATIPESESGLVLCGHPTILGDSGEAYLDAWGRKTAPGFVFPINTIPQGHGYESSAAAPGDCETVPEYHINFGLARVKNDPESAARGGGRGIVTSGGMGASAVTSITSFRTEGSPGGDGGNIDISFPDDKAGAIRFRGVNFITGGGTGFIKTRIPIVFERSIFNPLGVTIQSPIGLVTGSAGGRGSRGTLLFGGNGGEGGRAGDIMIDPNADIIPKPSTADSETRVIFSHNGASPLNEPTEIIGRVINFRPQQVSDLPDGGIPNDLLTLTFEADPGIVSLLAGQQAVISHECTREKGACLLGGSGGIAGGSSSGDPGLFGARGQSGKLTMPEDLWKALDTLKRLFTN